ncbi:hypothetical protein D8674_030084 [Pyrus ussuriensis x Pyrus communis]|uniref:Uncharacterized protein n=1 Tax=Pyrus ussuriensis x Pyrus communis TaxID=2448454 RepID=A0A5N5F7L2_9ROSA|nr:hypothetical protein D8674_030084 [Pyrus ussuriensis x Pyrus communis]
MLGSTFTNIAIWVFYSFNDPARAKVEFLNISLGKIGEHVSNWEHVNLQVINFIGELWKVYFLQHNGGIWVDASELEFQNGGGNKAVRPVTYASLHGHAFYAKPGLVLQCTKGLGIRNDAAKTKMVLDTGQSQPIILAVDYSGFAISEPPWLNYCREWGPKLSYHITDELKKVEKLLPGKLKSAFEKFVKSLPNEVLGEEGPTGPKMKNNWIGDEK